MAGRLYTNVCPDLMRVYIDAASRVGSPFLLPSPPIPLPYRPGHEAIYFDAPILGKRSKKQALVDKASGHSPPPLRIGFFSAYFAENEPHGEVPAFCF